VKAITGVRHAFSASAQSTSALYESVSAFADRPRASPSATSSSMWLTSGIAIAGNVMRQAPIANPGQAVAFAIE
jgi:hypothetical protein